MIYVTFSRKTGEVEKTVQQFDDLPAPDSYDTAIPGNESVEGLWRDPESGHIFDEERLAMDSLEPGPAPYILDQADHPEGTVIEAENNAGAIVRAALNDPIRLTTPGLYPRVTIRRPYPWLILEQSLEVTDA